MKLETFFEKFEQFADAPNAVAKMRELVLELAVQGKLVDQRPTEGDGHALLNQIRKKNPLPVTDADEEFGVTEISVFPNSWAPSKLGEVAEIVRGVTFPGSAKSAMPSKGDVACLRTASVQAEIDWDDLIFISPTHVSRPEQWVKPNDIMISMANSYALVGKVAIVRKVPQKATFGAFLAAIRPVLIEPYFLLYVLRSPRMQAAFRASSSQTTNIANISLGRMRPLPFPLPPLAEQKRIVAKLDEFMALCDRLEAQQQERGIRQAALTRASLARFAEAPTPANLNFLFHQSYTITPADLRKSILTLAVQGKLVPQDPNDEPADVLLECIAADVAKAIRAKLMRHPKQIPPCGDEYPFDLPSGWEWSPIGKLTAAEDSAMCDGPFGSKLKTEHYISKKGYAVLRLGNIGIGYFIHGKEGHISREHYESLSSNHIAPGDLLVAGLADPLVRCCEVPPDIGLAVNKSDCFRIRLSRRMDRSYVRHYLNSPIAKVLAAEENHGMTRERINLASAKALLVSVPPLAEQGRIVAKVDQLMALVDQLESQLVEAKSSSAALLEAIVHELLNPSAEVIDLASYRAAIGCYTINKMSQQPYFGRTAAMKTLYLAETHVGLNLGFQPEREAAGPLDPWLYRFEEEGKQKAWFKALENTSNGKMKVEYQPGNLLAAQAARAESQLAPEQRKEFDRLFDLLSDKKTEEVEIIATLFAAWNDFLIDGHAPSDDEIVIEVRENWHESKERFTAAQLRQWLGWLRKNSLVPQGRLPHTVHQSKLSLN